MLPLPEAAEGEQQQGNTAGSPSDQKKSRKRPSGAEKRKKAKLKEKAAKEDDKFFDIDTATLKKLAVETLEIAHAKQLKAAKKQADADRALAVAHAAKGSEEELETLFEEAKPSQKPLGAH